MSRPQGNPHLSPAGEAGHRHLSASCPHPEILPGDEVPVTVPAELPPEFPPDPDPVPHRYPPGKRDTPVTDQRIFGKELACPLEEDKNPLPGYLL